eukprot:jgi/Hompol1/6512/HPOL_003528-RA
MESQSPWKALQNALNATHAPIAQGTLKSDNTPAKIGTIPRFHYKRPTVQMPELLNAARAVLKTQLSQSILSNEDLDVLWEALCANATYNQATEERRISYPQFCKAKAALVDPKFQPYLKASLFLSLTRDNQGRVDVLQLFNFVLRKGSLLHARLDLSAYDMDLDGSLTEVELQSYIRDMMPTLKLKNITPSFEKFYLCTAVRKLMFFLDPLKRGKVPIENILLSPILTELFELRDPELPREFEQTNWFSSHSALRVYGQFLNLDVDRNGMISREELSKYRGDVLTGLFLDRVFQEYQTYGGEMDFNAFLDFVLVMENMSAPASITYCFKLLDIFSRGYLDHTTIAIFFKEVLIKMVKNGIDPVPVDDIVNEVFDMANPADLSYITLQ